MFDFIDRIFGRILVFVDWHFGDKEPFAFLGKFAERLAEKLGFTRTSGMLTRRNKAHRDDPEYMGKKLRLCIKRKNWRYALLLVEFADEKSQRLLLDTFLMDAKVFEVMVTCMKMKIRLTEDEYADLLFDAMIKHDADRLPLNGRQVIHDRFGTFPPGDPKDMRVPKSLEALGMEIAERHRDPAYIRYN